MDNKNLINNDDEFKKNWDKTCTKYGVNFIGDVPLPPVDRIIVIGDIHGDWEMMIDSLCVANLIEENNNNWNWIGGNTVVVQVGDQIDRCRRDGIYSCDHPLATQLDEGSDWKILQFFTKLHIQAMKVGGAVYSLLGNHELMNVDGNFNYVSIKGFDEFKNFKKPFGNDKNIIHDHLKNSITGIDSDRSIISGGREARRWAFKKGNPISEFLACTRQAVLIIGNNLFVHAGIIPEIARKYKVKDINKIMNLYLLNKLTSQDIIKYRDLLFESKSPL
jgi:hypothetical protein